jgi:hypothetical protein
MRTPFTSAAIVAMVLLVPPIAAQTSFPTGGAPLAPGVPSPEQFFGFPMGTERKLAGWDRIVEYFQTVDRASDRVVVQELGRTTMGRPYIMAIVSTPDTIAQLSRYQQMQKKLVDVRSTGDEEAARIAREGKAVLLIGTNVHATEIGNSQMANRLLHTLATESSPWVDHVLRNVILLLIPSQNPDGQQMVVDWYHKNLGTPYEDSPLPDLYHKYAGHDNNRDSYMLTQVETQHLTRVMYREWFPEVYLDKHQMGNRGARIFVPPFKNPPNPNVDPLVWSEVNLLGQAMAAKLHEAGKPGVVWGDLYTGFWQGANSTNPWWHNMVALLTEVASSRLATTVEQQRADPARAPRPARTDRPRESGTPAERDPAAPLPPPTDVQYRMNYLQPWMGGPWSLADVVEYQFLSTLGLLEGVANNREMLKRNFYLMNRRAVDLFRHGTPYAFVVPAAQRDPIAAAKLLQLLQAGGAEVHQSEAPFTADGRPFPAGSHVVLLSQPFGRWVKDMLEPQQYPDIRAHANAPVDRPYDVSAWTLGMLLGVSTVQIERPFEAKLSPLTRDADAAPGGIIGTGDTYLLDSGIVRSATAVNRLLKAGADVAWARDEIVVGERHFPRGTLVVSAVEPAAMRRMADNLRLPVVATEATPSVRLLPIAAPRIALFEPWGGNMDAGWTRWLLEQHEFAYVHARPQELRRPDLHARFDVIIIPEMTTAQILRGSQASYVRPEYRGGIGDEGVKHLREFVQAGGTVVTLGNAAQFAIEQLGVPFENVVRGADPDAFFCPGSLLRITVDQTHPIGFGMPEEGDAMFINNGGYIFQGRGPTPASPTALASSSATIVARYPNGSLLRSGWIVGEAKLYGTAAVVEAAMGRGRVIMHTFRVQNRAQTWGTFRLLFNSLFYGAAATRKAPTESLEPAKQ